MYKKLVLLFITFHLFSVIIWNLSGLSYIDKTIQKAVNSLANVVKPYMYGLSLWQNWGVFSPNPYTKETSTMIIIEKNNVNVSYLPKYAKDGMPFFFHRFRKFNDNIISKKSTSLKTAYLVYLCKEFANFYKPEFIIYLQIIYKDIPLNPKEEAKESYENIGEITCG